jgi:hypothetical protein
MSIVLMGSTSGSCTLQEQAVAGTSVLTLPVGSGTVVANNVNSAIVSGTAVASTSGTSINFTGIPSWVKRITVMFTGVSTNGTSVVQIQLGDAGGIETTGYLGSSSGIGSGVGTTAYTSGFALNFGGNNLATAVRNGSVVISNLNSNTWATNGVISLSDAPVSSLTSGSKALSDTLTQVRITTVNGTDTFDAGSINILYE